MNAFMVLQRGRAFNGVATELCDVPMCTYKFEKMLLLIQKNECPK
jgi:hypothetical protein